MELLRGIRHLLHAEGYTIKGVQKILREQGIDYVKQHGRSIGERAPAARGVHADARALPANVPAAAPAAARGPVPIPARRGGTRSRAGAINQLAAIEAAIKELEQCRSILLESMGKEEAVRAPRRARAVGA
jgi:DNA-binding transcriptional MerR regulator